MVYVRKSKKPQNVLYCFLTFIVALVFLNCSYSQGNLEIATPSQVFGLGNLWGITYSPNGRFIASYGTAGLVLWDTHTYESTLISKQISPIGYSIFSPDSRLIVARGRDSTEVWNIHKREITSILPKGSTGLGFTPDGLTLYLSHYKQSIELWDTKDWQIKSIFHQDSDLSFIDFSSSNSLITINDARTYPIKAGKYTLRIWDAKSQILKTILKGEGKYVRGRDINFEGDLLAILADGYRDAGDSIQIWNLNTSKLLKILLPQKEAGNAKEHVTSMIFSPNSNILVSSHANKILFWDMDNLKSSSSPAIVLEAESYVGRITFSPDGLTLASANASGTITLWDIEKQKPYASLQGYAGGFSGFTAGFKKVAITPDGSTLAAADIHGQISIWNTETGEFKGILRGHSRKIGDLAFRSNEILVSGDMGGTIKLWNINNLKEIVTPMQHTISALKHFFLPSYMNSRLVSYRENIKDNYHHDDAFSSAAALDKDGSMLAVSNDTYNMDLSDYQRGRIKLWDSNSGKLKVKLKGHYLIDHYYGVRSLAFHLESNTLASGGSNHTIMLWDTKKGKPKALFWENQYMQTYALDFSPDGNTLASFSYDGFIRLWDIENSEKLKGKIIKKWYARDKTMDYYEEPLDIAFSPDGNTLASVVSKYGYESIQLWDVEGGELKASLEGHSDSVTDITFDSTGNYLASSSADGTVRLWNIEQWTGNVP